MRRQVGVTLTGFGAFLLVLALMSRFFLAGQLIKFPVNEYSISRLTGTNVTYTSRQTGQQVTGATVRAVATTQGDVSSGTSSTAVWTNITGVFDITANPQQQGIPIDYTTERLAFNRRTGELVNGFGAAVGTARPNFSGQGYVWPIGTQKKTYQVFNTTLLKPEPAQYTGTTTVNGLSVYVFVEHVSNVPFQSANLAGAQANLTATYTYYVDPGTGSPVKISENQDETVTDPNSGATLVAFQGTLASTPQSIAAAVHTASVSDAEISGVQDIGPLVAGLVAIVLLVLGMLMILGSEGDEYEYEEDEEDMRARA